MSLGSCNHTKNYETVQHLEDNVVRISFRCLDCKYVHTKFVDAGSDMWEQVQTICRNFIITEIPKK
jgi:hypothetical protein